MRALNRRDFLLKAASAGGAVLMAGGVAGMVAGATPALDPQAAEFLRRWLALDPYGRDVMRAMIYEFNGRDYSHLNLDPEAVAEARSRVEEWRRNADEARS